MNSNFRAKVQAFGGFLTAMVIPNMGAFIAWGFITALFIPTGWMPNEKFATLVGPMVSVLLPLLLAYAGGKLVYDVRGGIAGTVGTIGLIVGAEIPMFLGAMIMGPFSAWAIKRVDRVLDKHIPTGFEMLIHNFSLGIVGFTLCLLSNAVIGPMVQEANALIRAAIQALVSTGILPLLSLVNEPAKVLFLNNVIDQGVYYPLGMQHAAESGKSIYFMLASNPGAGLGLLLAYSVFGTGASKSTAPGAIIIHFLGGIHEMYFPYVLMKPITILAMIGGAACGIMTFQFFDAGLVAGPSPGSIFAYLALTPKGNFVGVIAGVAVAAIVSFLITSVILKLSSKEDEDALATSAQQSAQMKVDGMEFLNKTVGESPVAGVKYSFIAFACDAGMGSSAMGASVMRRALKKAGIDVHVEHFAIEKIPAEADIVVVHENLADRVRMAVRGKRIVTIHNYLDDPALRKLQEEIVKQYGK